MKELIKKEIDIKEWKIMKDENGNNIGYKLNDNIVINKYQDICFTGNSNTFILNVNGKDIQQNGSGYTIKYLKELGSLYKEYATNENIKISYNHFNGNVKIIER